MKENWFQIFLLVLLAAAVRIVIWSNTYVISSDGPLYIEAAQYYYEGNFKQALSHPYHPLYPFLMSLVYRLTGNWEWAGMLISVILSSLAIVFIYSLGRRLFNGSAGLTALNLPKGPTIGIISCLFYAFHPISARLSAGILTPGTFIFLVVLSLWLMSRAIDTKKYRFFVLAGAGTLLCYATRPDGAILLPVFLGAVIFSRFKAADEPMRQSFLKEKILYLLLLILPWLLLAVPYLIRIKQTKGEWDISNKGLHIIKMLNPAAFSQKGWEVIEPEEAKTAAFILKRYTSGVLITLNDFIRAEHPLLLILLILGVLMKKRRNDGSYCDDIPLQRDAGSNPDTKTCETNSASGKVTSRLIGWLFFIWLMAMLRFAVFFDRLSKRYTVILAVITIFWAAAGLYVLVQWLNERFRVAIPSKQRFNLWAGVIAVLLVFSLTAFKPVDETKLDEKTTGEWIKNYHTGQSPPLIMCDSNRIPYYAGGRPVALLEPSLIGKGYEAVLSRAREGKADYLVVDNKIENYFPGFNQSIKEEDLRLICAAKEKKQPVPMKPGKEFLVYQIKPR